ncbi:MAG: response regulator [Desulfobulbaceae bacterium]|nr:response regulator [Desulfobulbaceae bacterium]
MKILVVDDNADDRTVLRLVVERQGHEAIEAEHGQQGFELAAAHRPDLIISDALMPVLDGFNFLKRLKEDVVLKTIPFIFYSATYQEDKDLALAASLGAMAYIFKPMDPAELWGEITEVLKKGGNLKTVAAGEMTDVEYLQKYSSIVATKLEEKVVELEKALAARAATEKALLQSREEWERSFEAIGDIALILAPDLRIIQANRQAYAVLAPEPGQELRGKFCYEAFQEGEQSCACCPLLLAKEFNMSQTCEVEHKGLGKTFQITVSPVFDPAGRMVSFVHFSKDITAQKELGNRLIQAQKLEAIGTLAGGIAHDFNNILTPILGYAEMAKDNVPPGSPVGDNIDQVITAALRARDLVQQILCFSRQKEQQRIPLAPHIIIKEAVKLLRASIPATIEIRQDIVDSGMILADATQIHQVVMNLCTNAYHAMREKGGVLAVVLQPCQVRNDDPKVNEFVLAPGDYVMFEVSDTGAGMDKLTMAKIFDPYFTTKKQGEGTGLGLSVVHGIVQECGGHITVYSEPGRGATFRVYLPKITSAQLFEPHAASEPLPHGTESILVVDDDQAIVDLDTRILEGLGYRVTGLTVSKEALQRFQAAPRDFDLVLTDMTMPGLTGLALSMRINAIRPGMPIILCTGFSELIDGDKAKAIGIQGFLKKPILRQELAETVRAALDGEKRQGKES